MSRRGWTLLLALLPVVALFALLGWALVQSGGSPGGLSVNSELGEVSTGRASVPAFSAQAVGGGEVNLEQFKGKVLMIDFWSSWCPPCRAEAPVLAQVYREYRERPVEFIGVAIWDDLRDITRFVDDFNVQYPSTVDPMGRIAIEYGVTGIPEKFFIDASGALSKKYVGPMDAETLRSILDEMLDQEG